MKLCNYFYHDCTVRYSKGEVFGFPATLATIANCPWGSYRRTDAVLTSSVSPASLTTSRWHHGDPRGDGDGREAGWAARDGSTPRDGGVRQECGDAVMGEGGGGGGGGGGMGREQASRTGTCWLTAAGVESLGARAGGGPRSVISSSASARAGSAVRHAKTAGRAEGWEGRERED